MVWDHFTKLDAVSGQQKRAECHVCKQDVPYNGNTTNLISHLRTTHRDIYTNIQDLIQKTPKRKKPDNNPHGLFDEDCLEDNSGKFSFELVYSKCLTNILILFLQIMMIAFILLLQCPKLALLYLIIEDATFSIDCQLQEVNYLTLFVFSSLK